ncbi:52 kDa repressor of the inhibitor of the protein kinase-like [Rhopalosiphum padi]|nr:52 kDa repressor of the inhibitor of the protein kinase-like [Rhopalosiphum padi]
MNKKGHKRSFQIELLNKQNWLAYSRNREGAFCKVCVLFGPKFGGIGGQRLGVLKEIPMIKYKDALHDFKIHMEREYHKTAIVRSLEFIKCFKGKQKPIEIQLDDQLNETVKQNKKKLIPIIKTIIFCGRHNISIRGHRDDVNLSNLISNDQAKNNFNIGIFKELLMFRIDAGDVDLRNHLEPAPKNATFVSKTIQNNLIDICGSIITDKLIKEVNECKFFSILCDETSDLSHIEQMSLSIRYVDLKSCLIKENFICFVPVYECTGENLANTIVQKLKEIDLSLEFLRGQGYDGEANMSGKYRGVQARILNLQPKSKKYLTLCVILPKELIYLKKKINAILPSSKSVLLVKLCETRWVESHEAIIRFSDMLIPIVQFLEDMTVNTDGNILSKCNGLLHSILTFEFILALEVAVEILSLTLPISRKLQDPGLDLTKCIEIIQTVLDVLKNKRQNATFNNIFNRAVSKAENLNIEVKTPRICKQQINRSNNITSSPEEYFKITVYFTVLDNFITSIQSMFFDNQNPILFKIQQLIPYYLHNKSEEHIIEGATFYEADLPGSIDELKGEIALWQLHWTQQPVKKEKINAAIDAFKETEDGYFPNIRQLLLILAILPVTTSISERSFSTLKRIKTYLRTTMGENRLNGLALLNIHKQIDVKPEEVLDMFSKSNPRKLQLSLSL